MAQVPQKTLNWLYDVLKREYRDPNRTYSDLAQTLAQYPGFAPRTDVYTSDNGAPALLLNLKGTIPVNFRGTVYRFPIAVWIPHAYPYEAPFAYVTPTDDMVVRPGQHVSAADGRIYHHYLARWQESAGRSNVIELLRSFADIFSREPPVMAKPQQQQQQQATPQQFQNRPPPVPPPPTDHQRYSSQPPLPGTSIRTASQGTSGPPPPPPKPSAGPSRPGSTGPPTPAPKSNRYDAPPPLPQQTRALPPQQTYSNGSGQPSAAAMPYMPQRTSSLRHQGYPPPDRQAPTQQFGPQSPGKPLRDQNFRPQPQPPVYSQNAQTPQVRQNVRSPQSMPPPVQPLDQQQAQYPPPQAPPSRGQPRPQGPPSYTQFPYQQAPQHFQQPPQQQPLPAAAQQAQPKPAAPKDLLSEEDPFQVSLTTSASKSNLPAPPIPTNPERNALLTHLSHLILQHLHTSIQQAQSSALPSLQSQHTALTAASQTLNSELQQLQPLSSQLSSNISALQSTLNSATTTIQSTQDPKHASHPDNIPAIDQIIIPPTVVARQLYDAVAEQRGYEAAIFALNDAFVRGRIGAEVWGRKVRECAREEMRRKWLVRKIGEGLGLEEL